MCVDNKKEQTELKATNIISVFHPKKKKKKKKKAGRHFGFFKKAGRHQNGAGRRALQKRPRQNTGDGLATQWESQTPTLRDRPWRGTLRASKKEGKTDKQLAAWPWVRHHANGAELETITREPSDF